MKLLKLKRLYIQTLYELEKNNRESIRFKKCHHEEDQENLFSGIDDDEVDIFEETEFHLTNKLKELEVQIKDRELRIAWFTTLFRIVLGLLLMIPFLKVFGILDKVLSRSKEYVFCQQNPEVISAYIFYAAICAAIGAWLIFSRKK